MKCKFFKTRYRVRPCSMFRGLYQAEFRYWWMPFYVQCFGANTAPNLDVAKQIIKDHQQQTIYEECYP